MNDPVELDPLARRVIAEGRHAFEPSELACARVRRAVDRKLSSGLATPALSIGNAAPWWLKVMVGATVASIVTVAFAYAIWRPAPAPLPRKLLPTVPSVNSLGSPPSMTTGAVQEPNEQEPSSQPDVAESQPILPRAQPAIANKSESLAEEVKLLASVNSAIQAHSGGQALRLLRAFDQQFKKPVLREERAAAGVLALCEAGQVKGARAAGKRFQTFWPRSPLTSRVVDSCIAAK